MVELRRALARRVVLRRCNQIELSVERAYTICLDVSRQILHFRLNKKAACADAGLRRYSIIYNAGSIAGSCPAIRKGFENNSLQIRCLDAGNR